jgi:hypothetical protein
MDFKRSKKRFSIDTEVSCSVSKRQSKRASVDVLKPILTSTVGGKLTLFQWVGWWEEVWRLWYLLRLRFGQKGFGTGHDLGAKILVPRPSL